MAETTFLNNTSKLVITLDKLINAEIAYFFHATQSPIH